MHKVILMLLLAVVSSSALATNWAYVGEVDTALVYVAVDSTRYTGYVAKVWVLYDYKAAHHLKLEDDKYYWSVKAQQEFDCKEKRSRILYLAWYSGEMGKGNNVKSKATPKMNWTPVIPESFGESLWKWECGSGSKEELELISRDRENE